MQQSILSMQRTKAHVEPRSEVAEALQYRIETGTAVVAVIGLGYVGLPLTMACARAGFRVIGLDVDPDKVSALRAGRSYIDSVDNEALTEGVSSGTVDPTSDYARLPDADIAIICVPTPLSRNREPDLRFVERTAEAIAQHLRRGQLVVLESTTYPGTTEEILVPILERSGLKSGIDFFVGFSPEREDPGNAHFNTETIPKIVAGVGEEAAKLVEAIYSRVVNQVIRVSTTSTAEAVKITENVFRAVNVALVNELKVIFEKMDIDVWEVIDAAATKPFGYMPFYPGPGLGGHCIPIDPFYLTWRAREFGVPTRFIELAGEINHAMPTYVVERLAEALDRYAGKSLGSSRILIVGVAYKKNVSDIRESPALRLLELCQARGANVRFHDPHVAVLPETREHPHVAGMRSDALTEALVKDCDAVIIATDHDDVDYGILDRSAHMIVDTRNAMGRRGLQAARIVKA